MGFSMFIFCCAIIAPDLGIIQMTKTPLIGNPFFRFLQDDGMTVARQKERNVENSARTSPVRRRKYSGTDVFQIAGLTAKFP
jgi:hypothetical protein